MKGKLAALLATALCVFTTGCKAARTMHDITQVTYTSDAGTILPELQWHEQFTISRDGVVLTRAGRTDDTEVNAGTWEVTVGAEFVDVLFAQLETVDPAAIEQVEPEDPPDGGGTEEYTVAYGGNKTLALWYDPGTTYTGGEQIVEPVQAFLQGLALPAEAASKYNISSP